LTKLRGKKARGGVAEFVAAGHQAAHAKDWTRVRAIGHEVQRLSRRNPDGPFLLGLAAKARGNIADAARYFSRALECDAQRYDAAIELAFAEVLQNRHAKARSLLDDSRIKIGNNPMYLNLAGETYSRMSLHEDAWQLFQQASRLQPNVDRFEFNLATTAVYVGEVDKAKRILENLIERNPGHPRNHFELAQLHRASDDTHIRQMLDILAKSSLSDDRHIYIYYALGKELEDLGRWEESFEYYLKAGNTVKALRSYDVARDVSVMNKIIQVCSAEWLVDNPSEIGTEKTPIFIVGLPRTGTTLADRIISRHSQVESAGETQLLQMVLRRLGNAADSSEITPRAVEKAAAVEPAAIAGDYTEAIGYRLGDAPLFIDKLPENVLFLGFIAKSWPDARIVHLRRNPMDACFATFKQPYFRFAYSLDDLAKYYLAYDQLSRHWRAVLGDRMVEVQYEALVTDPEPQIHGLLEKLGLPFENACLSYDRNASPVATASSAQIREKVHTRSVGKWKHYERQLEGLKSRLEDGGVDTSWPLP
jgi:tetratricopeptide (TPR) repeat protein